MLRNNIIPFDAKLREAEKDREVKKTLAYIKELHKYLTKGEFDKADGDLQNYFAKMKYPANSATLAFAKSGEYLRSAFYFLDHLIEDIWNENGCLDENTTSLIDKNILQNPNVDEEGVVAVLNLLDDLLLNVDGPIPIDEDFLEDPEFFGSKSPAEIIRSNNEYLLKFEVFLKEKQLKTGTIEKHMTAMNFLVNELLNEDEEDPVALEVTHLYLNEIFSEVFLSNDQWTGEPSMRQMLTTIGKFYSFLKEKKYIDKGHWSSCREELEEFKTNWEI